MTINTDPCPDGIATTGGPYIEIAPQPAVQMTLDYDPNFWLQIATGTLPPPWVRFWARVLFRMRWEVVTKDNDRSEVMR